MARTTTLTLTGETLGEAADRPPCDPNPDQEVRRLAGPSGREVMANRIGFGLLCRLMLVGAVGLVACNGSEAEPEYLPADEILLFEDLDQDGFGGATIGYRCTLEVGQSTNNVDCDDNDIDVFPGAVEICDDRDNDCDGGIDEGFAPKTFFLDADLDSFGDPAESVRMCEDLGEGFASNPNDCDDTDNMVRPTTTEICGNHLDDDCDGVIDNIFEKRCDDGKDDNCDGLIDCADPDCAVATECVYSCTDIVLPSKLPLIGITYDTNQFDSDFAPPSACAVGFHGGSPPPDIVYQWRSTFDGTVRIDTTGSSFDTVLSVYRNDCQGVPESCNDDANSSTHTSIVTIAVSDGDVLAITVDGTLADDGFSLDRGPGVLNIIQL